MPSYTAEELQRETGFDRRTIAYYVQEGLLPKVGRRGPRTRYPKLVMDRLLFVRRVREAEEAGEIGPVSLSELREIFERSPPELVAEVAAGRRPAASAIKGAASAGQRSARARRAALEDTWAAFDALESADKPEPELASVPDPIGYAAAEEPADTVPDRRLSMMARPSANADDDAAAEEADVAVLLDPDDAELGDTLAALQTRSGQRRREPGTLDRWTRVDISPDIALSVRGVTDEDAPLLEAIGRQLRRLIRRRGSGRA